MVFAMCKHAAIIDTIGIQAWEKQLQENSYSIQLQPFAGWSKKTQAGRFFTEELLNS